MENTKNTKNNITHVSEILEGNILILPIITRPIFPHLMFPITFSGLRFLEAIKKAYEDENRVVGLVLIEEKNDTDIFKSKLKVVGTAVKIHNISQVSTNTIQIVVQGLKRFTFINEKQDNNFLRWNIEYHDEPDSIQDDELKAYMLGIMNSLKEIFKYNPMLQEELKILMSQVSYDKPGILMDLIASTLKIENQYLQDLLEAFDLKIRSRKLLTLLKKELEITHLQNKIQKDIEDKVSKQQKEYFLREQLKAIKKELGIEKDDKTTEIDAIQEKLSKLVLSNEAQKIINEQIEKLNMLDVHSPEFHVTRSYIQTIIDLPWGIFSKDNTDIKKAKKMLDKDHYGLNDVKEVILEFISTIIKTEVVAGNILCLVGPPGVGKTSVGKSIANALNRKFYRFSVGGMRDEAEIKGHRRTYIGAMPGKIIESLKRTETANPVIMLDEIDKIGKSFQGDPASALLEVLDPEQNKDFLDHYLDLRFDLSKILFITTANQLDTIPQPLLDRMEIIQLPGYILEEKMEIAKRYLIPNQMINHGLKKEEFSISPKAVEHVIDSYAREAGVRNLEKQIKKIMRKVTLKLTEGDEKSVKVTPANLEKYLGKEVFSPEELYNKSIPGVVLGLAWTSMGGATLYIEAVITSTGKGYKQTGQLGSVMKESSEIAYSYIESLIRKENSEKDFFLNNFIHLHVPAGAVPKDGPSAGITMALALYSLVKNKPVKEKLAMTGEITLTGKVLPIGGLREKVIAARRVGVYELIVPKDNKGDFERLPDYIREGITIHYADYFEDVIKAAF
ncbi:MAG: endopeptidase La [Fusobacteriaceae bacterium]|nr:endopeptidase La [Fusobacteriaceae bacterium]MBP6467748.1 endopeptidase La [Fusobacteriaceae bacterium]MBU9918049.1 endopeptidase La [Fusobacteriaceae bacterium]